jgi:catechol 2,3-dioxygenase-like lactoylglutathione lyase family enzyme
LGIDHTAIVVADTDASLKFYRDLLGLHIVGTSENYGTEQEHLNNVFGAHLRITSLRGAKAPGVELLEYLTSRDGRPIPADEHADDVAHWQTEMVTSSTETADREVESQKVRLISSGVISLPDASLGFHKGLLLRDPDGHAVELVDR